MSPVVSISRMKKARDASEAGVAGLDDKEIGATPVPIVRKLPIGKHSLRITKPGYFPYENDFVINRNENTLVQVQLIDEASIEPWYYKWWVWAGVGTVVVGAVTTALLLRGDDPTSVTFGTPLP